MRKKELSQEEQLAQTLEKARREANHAAQFMSEPTRIFGVGEEVRFGAMKKQS